MSYKMSIIVLLFLAGSQLSCSKVSEAQTQQESNNYAKVEEIHSVNKLKVEVNTDFLTINSSQIETILAQSTPEIWLIFSCDGAKSERDEKCNQGNLNTKIPLGEQQIVKKYWKQSLRFKYKYLIQKFPNANDQYQESNKFSVMTNQFTEGLKDIYIYSPNGRKQISNSEADEIMKSVNIAAVEVIEKLKMVDSGNQQTIK